MPNFGSSQNLISQNLSQTVDSQGNPIISSDTSFGASPLGYAARVQALFGLPNSTFELTPPDTTAVISQANPLPYWDVQDYSSGVMSGSAIYDSTTNSWGVLLNPGTAASGDYLTLTTRSYLINDTSLGLRQQALAVVSKNGTYSSTTQWNMQLTATYYDGTDTVLHSGTVATIYDNTTWTSMAGTTTTSGTAISASAQYVDLQFKLTATAAVTSATSVTIKSCLLTTSSAASKSAIVTETFTSSTTWTRPTGVENLLAIICVGGGGGGGSGGLDITTGATTGVAEGGGGGGSGAFAYLTNVYIGTAPSFTVTVGAGGSGGTANVVSKADGSTTESDINPVQGAAGGTSSFGTLVYGNGASATGANQVYNGGSGGAPTSPIWGIQFQSANGVAGGAGGRNTTVPAGTASTAGTFVAGTYTSLPLVSTSIPTPGSPTAATAGTFVTSAIGAGSVFTATGTAAATAGSGYFIQAAGGGGAGAFDGTNLAAGAGGAAQPGAGGGGGGVAVRITSGGTSNAGSVSVTGGDGGNATGTAGAGGGGGGGAFLRASTSSVLGNVVVNAVSGKGGNGSQGFVIISYVA